jgi:hypothetical protein
MGAPKKHTATSRFENSAQRSIAHSKSEIMQTLNYFFNFLMRIFLIKLFVIMILYHKVSWKPELSVCVERENDGAPKRRAFHIDTLCFKVIGIPVSPV